MNKTYNINLAGQSFTINDDAYELLIEYFNSIRNYYQNEDGKDEIIQDIEARFAEIFYKNGKDKIVSVADANNVINMMGRPQDFEENEEQKTTQHQSKTDNNETTETKKLYRDVDDNIIGGVCSGLSKYFGINDPIWIRILFIISPFITFGTALIIYIILWIIMPEAKTKAQKLAMQGKPINLSNLEKKNSDGLVDSSNPLNILISIFGKVANAFIWFFVFLFKIIIFLIFVSIIIAIFAALVSFVVTLFAGVPIANKFFFDSSIYSTFLSVGGILVGISSLIGIILTSIHLLSKNNKPLTKKVVLPLIALFFIGMIFLFISAKESSTYFAEHRKLSQTVPLQEAQIGDTFKIDISYLEEENLNIEINSFSDLMDFINKDYNITNDVEIRILPSNNNQFYTIKEFSAYGKTEQEALKNATSIQHQTTQINNKLVIDPFFKYNTKDFKFRNQRLILKVFVPEGKIIAWNKHTEEYIDVDNLNINWNKEDIKNLSLNINTNKNDSANVVININGKTISVNAAQDSIKINGTNISTEDEEDIEDELDDFFTKQHYIFIMKDGQLVPID
ncbi:MAG: PspC domain-containing protein [Sphingobacteriales bacterium]|nr:MAG: PspC domain-containing protein [Sphingobacteriales bacterium]